MRRAVLALAGLAAGTTLLVVVKGGPQETRPSRPAAADGPLASASTGTTLLPAEAVPPPPSVPAADEPSVKPSATRAPTTGPASLPKPRRTTRPTAAPTHTAAPSGPYRVNGSYEQNPYGAVQVQIVMDGGKFTDVVALIVPNAESRSQSISDSAIPKLRADALRKQSAALDTVSGATVTSDSYKASLQAAIDRAATGAHD